jgi:hypothetical protein
MSRWHVTAIERLGAPDVAWPSVYGPVASADPVAANSLHTRDLTPYLAPLTDFSAQMERDLTTSSFSSIKLDLVDADGTLADALGPFSATLAATSRYFGPWIQVIESWGTTGTALRFLGYIDETSIQWSEDEARTQCTVIHASQLLRERLITDYPSLLRPWPSVPTNASQSFTQSTADDLLHDAVTAYTQRTDKTTLEAALWAAGQLSWIADIQEMTVYRIVEHIDTDPTHDSYTTYYAVPAAPAASVIIGGTAYAVAHLEWDTSISAELITGDPATNGSVQTWRPVRIVLQNAPNLTGLLTLGATVTWGIPEAQRTHYLLDGSSITAPASGSDGVKSIKLNTVEQLAVGDVLTLTFSDATSGTPRTVTADLPPIIDMDGETGRVFLASALSQGYTYVSKVRRNSQDPVLFDGVAYAHALCAPFAIDTSAFAPAPTDVPVLVWQPYDLATPSLYGVHLLQTTSQAGALRAARRGPDNGSAAFPTAGVWSGSFSGAWSWLGLPAAEATHQIYGDVLQWPGGTNAYTAPVLYIEGDLSAGSTTPPNGWRHGWRSWKDLSHISQDPESTWTGTAIAWAPTTASGDIPAKVVAFAASTPTPGRYQRLSAGTWGFQAHTANATLGTSSTPTLTGTYPTGNTLALGMGIYTSGDEQEALLALVATGLSYPFTAMTACLLSQASGGNLTVRQSPSLWTSGSIPAGPWALGGGLAVQSYTETIDGLVYPRTKLHKLNGSTVVTADLKTLEVIPQTLQPLLLTGTAGSRVIGGWYALALETYADANYVASRCLRFLHLSATLEILNGTPEPDPSTPTSLAANFSRGDVISSLVPDGALIAKLVRTSNTADTFAGLAGGRIFTVGSSLPTTVERLKIGATVPQGNTLTVAKSGDGMTAAAYLEAFAAAQLASAVPAADGSMRLVSRSGGTLQLRSVGVGGAGRTSVQPTERGKQTKTQVWQGYLRKVRVSYADLLAGGTASIEVQGSFDGGRILELDMSNLVCSATMARALGSASVHWFGQPSPVLSETWSDRTGGVAGSLDPTWWSTWQIGDRVTFTSYLYSAVTTTTITAYKILKLQPGLEARTVNVELRQQPFAITVQGSGA